jgi:hypothetical protein
MNKRDMEKEFLSNLERIMNGEEMEPGLNEDNRSVLDFARKMISLRVSPSTIFHDRLRNRLLQKIEKREKDAEKVSSFWERLWDNWNQPVWRTVTAGLVTALLIVGIMGRLGMFTFFPSQYLDEEPAVPETTQAPEPEPAPAPAPAPLELELPIEVVMTTDEEAYQADGEVTMEFVFINRSDEQQTIDPFPPLVEITKPESGEPVQSFPSGDSYITLSPGESVEHELNWNLLDSAGNPIIPGWYNVYASELSITKDDWQRTIVMSGGGSILVRYPQGAMEKDIAVDQSRTVNGVTVTLERAEFTAEGSGFYAFTTTSLDHQQSPTVGPDSYPSPEPLLPEPVIAHAEYTVDGVTKDAGYASFGSRDDGLELSWKRLDPIPSDAEELTFTITQLGHYDGPWKFDISLR